MADILLTSLQDFASPYNCHIYRSINNGSIWNNVYDIPSGNDPVYGFTETENGVLLAVTYWTASGSSILKSIDHGATWAIVANIPPPVPYVNGTFCFDIKYICPGVILVVSFSLDTGDFYTYISTDEGSNWSIQSQFTPPNNIGYAKIVPGSYLEGIFCVIQQTIYGGWTAMYSNDFGVTWTFTTYYESDFYFDILRTHQIGTLGKATLVAGGANYGNYNVSYDGGANFSHTNIGASEYIFSNVMVGTTLVAIGSDTVTYTSIYSYYSNDLGVSWVGPFLIDNDSGLSVLNHNAIVVGDAILCILYNNTLLGFNIWQSTDKGASWGIVGTLPANLSPHTFFNTKDSNSVMLATEYYNGYGPSLVFRSIDGGDTWDLRSTFGGAISIDTVYVESGTFLMITKSGEVLRSDDYGISWTVIAGFSPSVAGGGGYIEYLGDNGGNKTFLVSIDDGYIHSLWLSIDYGINWSLIYIDDPTGYGVGYHYGVVFRVLSLGSGDALIAIADYFYSYYQGVIKVTNWGTSWSYTSTENYSDFLKIGGTIYACGFRESDNYFIINKSVDNGSTWASHYVDGTILNSGRFIDIGGGVIVITSWGMYNEILRSIDNGSTWGHVTINNILGPEDIYPGIQGGSYGSNVFISLIDASSDPDDFIFYGPNTGGSWIKRRDTDAAAKIKTTYFGITGSIIADFSADVVSGSAPLTVNFTDLSTGSPTTWDWDFGDGTAHGTTQNPTHIYTIAGTFTVILVASNGSSDTKTRTDYINVGMAADFSIQVIGGNPGLKVQFTDQSLGDPTRWAWNFGDQ